jgi:hypothetical protein
MTSTDTHTPGCDGAAYHTDLPWHTRVVCPVCGRTIEVLQSGYLASHEPRKPTRKEQASAVAHQISEHGLGMIPRDDSLRAQVALNLGTGTYRSFALDHGTVIITVAYLRDLIRTHAPWAAHLLIDDEPQRGGSIDTQPVVEWLDGTNCGLL